MIELHDVVHHYGVRPVLRGIDLRIERGELVVVLGPNGMGKTTLLGVIGGVLAPLRGSVVIDGKRRRGSVEEELAIRKTAVYLPDQPWLPGNRTGREFLFAVGRLLGWPDEISCPIALSVGMFVAFGTGPSLEQWRLTGRHRMVSPPNTSGSEFLKVG